MKTTCVLFVCHGNICRSPMAEYILKDLVKKANREDDFEIESCATSREEIGNDIDYRAKSCLDRHGISYNHRSARQITQNDLDYFDLIYIMDNENMWGLKRLFGTSLNQYQDKISLLMKNRDVSDPWYTGNFESTFKDCLEGCKEILERY